MKMLFALILFGIVSLSADTKAQEPSVPPVVAKGFDEFQKNGTLAAVNVWTSGSARDNDEEQDRATAKINGIQNLFGRMLGYEPIRVVALSPSTQRAYAAVKFEKGVAWMSFDCFRPENEWIISRFNFGTNADLILPPNILGGQ